MSRDFFFHPANDDLDPRDAGSVTAWLRWARETGAALPSARLADVVDRTRALLIAEASEPPHEHTTADHVELSVDGVQVTLNAGSGFISVSGSAPDFVDELVHLLCDVAGWVAFDPQHDSVIAGIDFTCASCASAIAPTASSCAVCGSSIDDAAVRRPKHEEPKRPAETQQLQMKTVRRRR